MRLADNADALFAAMPTAIALQPLRPRVPAHRAATPAKEAWINQWPGDETEEQLLDALRTARTPQTTEAPPRHVLLAHNGMRS